MVDKKFGVRSSSSSMRYFQDNILICLICLVQFQLFYYEDISDILTHYLFVNIACLYVMEFWYKWGSSKSLSRDRFRLQRLLVLVSVNGVLELFRLMFVDVFVFCI